MDFTDTLFEAVNLWMLFWWGTLILAPGSRFAWWVAVSWIPVAIPVLVYCVFLIPHLPEIGPILVRPQLTPIQNLLGTERGAFTAWVHFLVMDYLVGRVILIEGLAQKQSLWLIRVFLVLTLMLGPIGGFLSLLFLKKPDQPA